MRQNTPHPKELKAKAHKLFSKEKSKVEDAVNLDTLSEEVSFNQTTNIDPFRHVQFTQTDSILVVVQTIVGQNSYQFDDHG